MSSKDFADVSYSKTVNDDFIRLVRKKVNAYFRENDISRYGNKFMHLKTLCMFVLYLGPYFLMMTGVITSPWMIYLMWLVMGFGMAGIGLAVMHDANHGVYSKNKRINRLLGYSLDLVGGNSSNWKIQHNVLHHTYTNVDGMDEDINGHTFIRLSPHQKRHRFQRFQHIYAWFFYGIMTLYWVTVKDIFQLKRYREKGLVKGKSKYRSLLLELILWKIVYFGYILILPMIVLSVSPLLIIFSFLSMHFIGGLVLSSIFQPAHVVPSSEYKPMDDQSSIKNTWAIHQLLTTTNFAPSSRIFSWYIGGLNYQIEHHLFPNICHIHYRAIAGIIEKTAAQFELPYHSQKNFALALINHGRMLRSLGRHDRLTHTTAN